MRQTGEELYQQMHEEIKILEKEKVFKIKDSSVITEDEKPFDIPDSWKWVRLGEILNIESGKGLTAKQMRQGDIPVFGGNGITGYHDEALIEKETVVIGRVGFYCGSINLLYGKWLQVDGIGLGYNFWDTNLTYAIHPSEKDEIVLTGFFSRDNISVADSAAFGVGVHWYNAVGSAYWNHRLKAGNWRTSISYSGKWRDDGTFLRIFQELSEDADMENLSLDSTVIKAHPHSAGAKKGL